MPSIVESTNSGSCPGELSGKRIILGVTGSIAAYKAANVASSLVKLGADVHVVMTEHATKLIGPATFWSITSNAVSTDLFEEPSKFEITHVSLPESADLFLVAPASANIIAKMAHGIADDMLSTMALVVRCPVIVAPAMNTNMLEHPVTIDNVKKLRKLGHEIIEPALGRLACGIEGVGRLAEPDVIVNAARRALLPKSGDLNGLNVLVTAGPTREAIDPVRFISNRSSGKMGYAIAQAAADRGAKVTLVSGPTELPIPWGVERVDVETVEQMLRAVVKRYDSADVFICAAAPADYVAARVGKEKIKKSEQFSIDMVQADDILSTVTRAKGTTVVAGFAAETQNVEQYAREKLERKNLDFIVANDVSPKRGVFGSDDNEVTIISRMGEVIRLPKMAKSRVADAILDYTSRYLEERVEHKNP